MAKPKSDETPAQKATLDARQKLENARKAHEAKPTDATKKAVADAENAVKAAQAVENRERFVRVGGGRVKKVRQALRNLAGVAAPRSYTYTLDDIAKAETAITSEMQSAFKKLRSALEKGATAAKAEDDFTF